MEGIKLKNFKMNKLEKLRMDPNSGPPTISIIGKRNSGKCLYKGTKIIMYDGSIKCVEDINQGDQLMGPDSKCKNVLSTTTGRDKLYKIEQQNGKDYIVNSKHILTLINENGNLVDKSILELLRTNEKNQTIGGYLGVKSKEINFRSCYCKIDPYKYGKMYGVYGLSVDSYLFLLLLKTRGITIKIQVTLSY